MRSPRLVDYLDKGASLGIDVPCLTMGGTTWSYGDVQRFTYRFAAALERERVGANDRVAVLSADDPVAFSCVLGISRAGAAWCPLDPRGGAEESRRLLNSFDCSTLIFHSSHAELVDRMRGDLPQLRHLVCIDGPTPFAPSLDEWLADVDDSPFEATEVGDMVMLVGAGGTTGETRGAMLSGHNIEAMTASTLIGYPFAGRPVYLALAPLTHVAGVMCFPVMALGGRIVVMPTPDLGEFLVVIERQEVTHTFVPSTLIDVLLDHPDLPATDLSSLQCCWYGAAPIAVGRLTEAITRFGPVMAQLFGQAEASMMISTLSPADHFNADGSVATARLASAGRPAPLLTVGIMDEHGCLLPAGQRGEIVVRGPLVMLGYYKNAPATAAARRFGWQHTGDLGYLDADGYLFIVDRASDMTTADRALPAFV